MSADGSGVLFTESFVVFLLSLTLETGFLGDRDFFASNCESLTNFTVDVCVVVTPSLPTDFFFFFVGVTLGLITGVDTSLLGTFFYWCCNFNNQLRTLLWSIFFLYLSMSNGTFSV